MTGGPENEKARSRTDHPRSSLLLLEIPADIDQGTPSPVGESRSRPVFRIPAADRDGCAGCCMFLHLLVRYVHGKSSEFQH